MTLLNSVYKGTIKGAGYGTAAAVSFAASGFFSGNTLLQKADELCGVRAQEHYALPEMVCMSSPGPAYLLMGIFLQTGPIVLAPFIIAAGAALGGTIGAVTHCLSDNEDETPPIHNPVM